MFWLKTFMIRHVKHKPMYNYIHLDISRDIHVTCYSRYNNAIHASA